MFEPYSQKGASYVSRLEVDWDRKGIVNQGDIFFSVPACFPYWMKKAVSVPLPESNWMFHPSGH